MTLLAIIGLTVSHISALGLGGWLHYTFGAAVRARGEAVVKAAQGK